MKGQNGLIDKKENENAIIENRKTSKDQFTNKVLQKALIKRSKINFYASPKSTGPKSQVMPDQTKQVLDQPGGIAFDINKFKQKTQEAVLKSK